MDLSEMLNDMTVSLHRIPAPGSELPLPSRANQLGPSKVVPNLVSAVELVVPKRAGSQVAVCVAWWSHGQLIATVPVHTWIKGGDTLHHGGWTASMM